MRGPGPEGHLPPIWRGVPGRIVFDNASGVGRRIRDRVTLTELFLRFKCHYGFWVSFCNPASGHEKGHVENKVGYIRRNLFVPMPAVESLEAWNKAAARAGGGGLPAAALQEGPPDRGAVRGGAQALGPASGQSLPRGAARAGAHRRIRQVLPGRAALVLQRPGVRPPGPGGRRRRPRGAPSTAPMAACCPRIGGPSGKAAATASTLAPAWSGS